MSKAITLPLPILTFLKWQELTTGRDKVLRLVAYFSKYVLEVGKTHGMSADTQKRISSGASNIGTTRKLIRFFRSVEYLNEMLKSFSISDDTERYLTLFKAFSLMVWMIADHIQWLHKAGYIKVENLKKVDEAHSKGWFFGLAAGIVIAAYKLKQALEELRQARALLKDGTADANKVAELNKKLKAGDDKRNKQVQSLIKNSIDIVIPSARLGWLPVSDGTVGLAGTATSLIGIYDTWPSK